MRKENQSRRAPGLTRERRPSICRRIVLIQYDRHPADSRLRQQGHSRTVIGRQVVPEHNIRPERPNLLSDKPPIEGAERPVPRQRHIQVAARADRVRRIEVCLPPGQQLTTRPVLLAAMCAHPNRAASRIQPAQQAARPLRGRLVHGPAPEECLITMPRPQPK